MGEGVEIVEVGPRDGLQGIGPFVPTETKLDLVLRLHAAGLGRIEVGSFVSATAVPQMRDTPELLAACTRIPGLVPQILVPSEKRGRDAVAAGARCLAYVLSVSESHNRANVRRSPSESAAEYERFVASLPADAFVRLNLSTCFDCPFEGRIAEDAVLALLDRLVPMRPEAEFGLCDTTGRAEPSHVASLFTRAMTRFPDRAWAFHAHDTYGTGAANVYAAYEAGVRVMDAAVAGLGGCPFAPGATGNVATEDLAWMFARRGVPTGIELAALVAVARDAAKIPGATPGGRVRDALAAAERAVRGGRDEIDRRENAMPSFVVKAAPRPEGADRLVFDEKTMWRGKTIRTGDEVFVFAAEHNGGRGLVARGIVIDAARGEGIRVGVTVERTDAVLKPLGRADLRPFRDRLDAGPEAEIDHKLYRQATNKIAGISEAAAAFLRGFF